MLAEQPRPEYLRFAALLEEESGVWGIGHREQLVGHNKRGRIVGPGQSGDDETSPGRATEQNGGEALNTDVQLGAPVRGFDTFADRKSVV